MKNLKKILAILLIASMILTTNATMLFATEVNEGTEEQIESSTEETTFEEEEPEEDEAEAEEEAEEETTIGEKLGEPEEEETEAEEEEETTVGDKLGEPELVGAGKEEPEEETTSTNEEETLSLENKKDNKSELYGDSDIDRIEFVYEPIRSKYYVGNKFDPLGLVIRVYYTEGESITVDYGLTPDDFSFDPTPDTPLTIDIDEVKIKYADKQLAFSITVEEGTPLYEENTFYMIMSKSASVGLDENGHDREDLNVHYHDIKIPVPSGKQALGWYMINIDGMTTINEIYDEYNSNYDDKNIVTLDEAFNDWDFSYGSIAYGLVLKNKDNPNPNPNPTPTYVDDGGSDGPSDPNVGPMGKQREYTNYGNGISSLKEDFNLLLWLMSFPENMYRQKTIARDENGNVAYGRWLHVPGTMTWYFFVGDFDANGMKPNSGFIVSGRYKLEWGGQEKWFRFDGNAVLVFGWYQEGNRISFLQNNPLDYNYGEEVTGPQVIGGVPYNFDASGALIS